MVDLTYLSAHRAKALADFRQRAYSQFLSSGCRSCGPTLCHPNSTRLTTLPRNSTSNSSSLQPALTALDQAQLIQCRRMGTATTAQTQHTTPRHKPEFKPPRLTR